MAASNQTLKDFFSSTGNNPTLTAGRLAKLADWGQAVIHPVDGDGEPRDVTAGDLVDYIYGDLERKVKHWLKDEQAVTF